MSQKKFTQSAKRIQTFLQTTSDVLSRTSGFVKRKSKMTGSLFIQTFLLGWLQHPNASLSVLAQRAAELGLSISPQGIAQRFKAETVTYTQALFQESLQQFHQRIPLAVAALQQFTGIHLLDSTHFELPDALQDRWRGAGGYGSGAGLKMQLSFEYLRGNLETVALQDGIRSDRRYAHRKVRQGVCICLIWATLDGRRLQGSGKPVRFSSLACVRGVSFQWQSDRHPSIWRHFVSSCRAITMHVAYGLTRRHVCQSR